MKVFLSWSGNKSKDAAVLLRDWLPMVLQEVEPWLSAEDMQAGERWTDVLSTILQEVDLGIICITRDNLNSSWLHFEAGAISKNKDSRLFALCIGIEIKDLEGPLSLFQGIKFDQKGLFEMARSINARLSKPLPADLFQKIFNLTYDNYEKRIAEIFTIDWSIADFKIENEYGFPGDGANKKIIDKLDKILAILAPRENEDQPLITPKKAPVGIPKIFVGSSTEGLPLAHAIQENLFQDAEVTLWTQEVFNFSSTTIESIVDTTFKFDFAILLFTPDDVLDKKGKKYTVARDNILFELGLFTGALGRARTFLVIEEGSNIHLPSDLSGVTAATYKNRQDGNLLAALAPVCQRIKRAMGTSNN